MQSHALRSTILGLTRKHVSLHANFRSKQDKNSEMAVHLSTFLHSAPDRTFQRTTSSWNCYRYNHLELQLILFFFLIFPVYYADLMIYFLQTFINLQLGPTLNIYTTKLWHRQYYLNITTGSGILLFETWPLMFWKHFLEITCNWKMITD